MKKYHYPAHWASPAELTVRVIDADNISIFNRNLITNAL